MNDGFVKQSNERLVAVENIVTVIYMEYTKDFVFAGEAHDFWEFTYIDKGCFHGGYPRIFAERRRNRLP